MYKNNVSINYSSPNMNLYPQTSLTNKMTSLGEQYKSSSIFQNKSSLQNSQFFGAYQYSTNNSNSNYNQQQSSNRNYNPSGFIWSDPSLTSSINPKREDLYKLSLKGNSMSSNQLDSGKKASISLTTSMVGLQNLGNTCFMNTCLQNLIHTELFMEKLFALQDPSDFRTPITKQFYHICTQFQKSLSAVSPFEFKKAFAQRHPSFQGYAQHDTQEFCRVLLEDISSELNRVKGPTRYKELNSDNMSKIQSFKAYDELSHQKEDSIIIDTFYGQIINIFKCPCSKESYSHEKLLDIPLLLPSDSNVVSLQCLLATYFQSENIQWETKCVNCRKKTNQRKDVFFSQLPEILILSLQRNNGRIKRKNNIEVSFEKDLNLDEYSDRDCVRDQRTVYELYGIGHHSGTMDFGHYFSQIKINGNWVEFNDSIVSKYSQLKQKSNSVYVLFYRKI